jgi:hypothetical protein
LGTQENRCLDFIKLMRICELNGRLVACMAGTIITRLARCATDRDKRAREVNAPQLEALPL